MNDSVHMRRTDRMISDESKIDLLLREGRFTTVALNHPEGPYVVTLSYGYDAENGRLYFHVAHEGRKLDAIRHDARACATVISESGYSSGECEHPFESLVLFGTMRLVDSDEEKTRAIHCLVDHLEADPQGYWFSRSWKLADRITGFSALAFEIERVSAKAGK